MTELPSSYRGAPQIQDVKKLYLEQGWPINRICRELKVSYGKIRSMLQSEGIKIRGRGSYALRGSSHPAAKLTDSELLELESELHAGCQHGELAEKYGVSRERIRQIARRIGSLTGRQLQRLRRAEREQDRQQDREVRKVKRQINRDKRYGVWRDLWALGLTAAQMAERLCLKASAVSVRIVNLRKQYPEWFPRRRVAAEQGCGRLHRGEGPMLPPV